MRKDSKKVPLLSVFLGTHFSYCPFFPFFLRPRIYVHTQEFVYPTKKVQFRHQEARCKDVCCRFSPEDLRNVKKNKGGKTLNFYIRYVCSIFSLDEGFSPLFILSSPPFARNEDRVKNCRHAIRSSFNPRLDYERLLLP